MERGDIEEAHPFLNDQKRQGLSSYSKLKKQRKWLWTLVLSVLVGLGLAGAVRYSCPFFKPKSSEFLLYS